MPAPVQRGRFVALLLLLLTPGLGGWAVQALHPCPAAAVGHHHGSDGHGKGSSAPRHEAQCHCIGSCHATPAVEPASAPTVAAPIPVYCLTQGRPAESHFLATGHLPELHPPATAPPSLS
jgi:hypothetical protein